MTDVVGSQVVVSSAASPRQVLLVPPTSGGQEVLRLVNRDATNSVFLGDSAVVDTGATHGGLEVKPAEALAPFSVPPETSVYGYATAGSPRVDLLRVVAD